MNLYANTTERGHSGRLRGWLGLTVLTVSLFAGLVWAGESVKISSLLADPRGYNMKLVNVEGVVMANQMNHFIGSTTKLEKCIQNFVVKDDTGEINAVYATICQKGTPILENGDHVKLEAHYSGVLEVRSLTKN
jgi:hypothetical protein